MVVAAWLLLKQELKAQQEATAVAAANYDMDAVLAALGEEPSSSKGGKGGKGGKGVRQ